MTMIVEANLKIKAPSALTRLVLVPLALLCLAPGFARPVRAEGLDIPSSALSVAPLNRPHVVRGYDGVDHVEYDLLVTNAFVSPVTVTAVEVTGPGGGVLQRVTGATLAAATQGVLLQSPLAAVPASGSATIEIDLVLPPGRLPARLSHRITYAVKNGTPHTLAILGRREVRGPQVVLLPFHAVTIEPPLLGPGWLTINGCCTPNAHRNVRVAADTRIGTAETFAIDFVRVDGNRFYAGDGTKNAQYAYFGVPIHAVAAGTVVALHDGMDDSIPFKPPTTVHKPEDFGGNYVLVRQATGVYAFYAHLRKGTVAVAVGRKVRAGEVIGRLGNSGNSTNAHLHFGLLDRPDFVTGYSLPFVFARFAVSGRVTGADDNGTLHIAPASTRARVAYPLVGAIAAYR